MRKLLMERGRGKTTALIYTSATTGYPILIGTRASKEYIKSTAREMGLCIPEPICVGDDFRGCKLSTNHVLIDEADSVLASFVHRALGAEVTALTMTVGDAMDVTITQ